MSKYGMRLFATTTNGTYIGDLSAATDIKVAFPFGGESGSISFSYPRIGPHFAAIARDAFEVHAEIDPLTGIWSEPDGGGFYVTAVDEDEVEKAESIKFAGVDFDWYINRALWYEGPTDGEKNDERRFSSTATPDPGNVGRIMRVALDEALARGTLTQFNLDLSSFTKKVDSSGKLWSSILSIGYRINTPVLPALKNLREQGLVVNKWRKRKLVLEDGDGVYVDRTIGNNPVLLTTGQAGEITEAPLKISRSDLATVAVARGDEGVWVEVTDPAAVARYGRIEVAIDQGGIKDPALLQLLAEQMLTRFSEQREQMTHGLQFESGKFVPFRDYMPGDFVLSDTSPSIRDTRRVRVRQITLTKSSGAGLVEGNVVLNDKIAEFEETLVARMNGILGGATQTGGSGARPTDPDYVPPPPDVTVPKPPGITAASAILQDGKAGQYYALVTVTIDPPIQNTDGSNVTDLDEFIVQGRVEGSDEWVNWGSEAYQEGPVFFALTASPLVPNTWYEIRAFARDKTDHISAPSAVLRHRTTDDLAAPNPPSALDVDHEKGMLVLHWDGLDHLGNPMPSDFSRTTWYVDQVSPLNETTREVVGTLETAGTLIPLPSEYGVEQYFQGFAEDFSGNVSTGSPIAQGTSRSIMDDDLDGTTINDRINDIMDDVVIAGDVAVAAGKRITASTSDPSSIDGYPVGALWYKYVGNEMVGAWRLLAGSPNTWTPYTMSATAPFFPKIDIGSGTYGDLEGGRLKAGTVLTKSLAVVDFTNQFTDPQFNAGYGIWEKDGSGVKKQGTGAQHGTYYSATDFAVIPGEKFVGGYTDTRSGSTSTGQSKVHMRRRIASTEAWAYFGELAMTASAGDIVGTPRVIPADTDRIRLGFFTESSTPSTTTIRISNLWIRKQTGSILLEDGAVTAEKVRANEIGAQHLQATIALLSRIIAGGDPNGERTEIGASGVRYFGPIGEASSPSYREISKFGRDLRIIDATGTDAEGSVYGLSNDGELGVRAASIAEDPLIGGNLLMGTLAYQPEEVTLESNLGIMDGLAHQSEVGQIDFTTGFIWKDSTWKPVTEIMREQRAGRSVHVWVAGTVWWEDYYASNQIMFSIRKTQADLPTSAPPPTPGIGTPAFGLAWHVKGYSEGSFTHYVGHHVPNRSEIARWLVTARNPGNGRWRVNDIRMLFQDAGTFHEAKLKVVDRRVSDSDPTPGSTPTPQKTYTSRFYSNYLRRAQGVNVTPAGDRSGQAIQGWADTINHGAFHSILGFTGTAFYGEKGRTISQVLAGANIDRVRLRLSQAAGFARPARLGIQSSSTAIPTTSWNQSTGRMSAGDTLTTILNSAFRSGLANGERYITLGPDTAADSYSTFHGSSGGNARRAMLEITYTR